MKHSIFLAFLLCIVSGLTVPTYAKETFVSLKIGPTWPQEIISSDNPTCWDGELMYGTFVDRKVGFGVAADFLWNTKSQVLHDTSTGLLFTTKSDESYMIPVMGFLVFDPLPNAMIHPMLRFEIGYNSLIYNSTNDSIAFLSSPSRDSIINLPQKSKSGYYYGLIVKLGVDGLYNLGEQTAIFAGLEYQWAKTRTNANSAGLFSRRDMSGIGIRMGFRFLM
jgi:hypothetical protein